MSQQPPPPPPPGEPPPPPPPPGGPPPPPGGPPPYHQPPQQVSTAGQPGDLGTRFVAKLIDGILLAVTIGLVVLLFGIAVIGMGMNGWGARVIGILISTAILIGYYSFMESSRGQTIGKMILNLKVQNLEGQNPTIEQALKRNMYFAIYLIGILPILGWLIFWPVSLAAAIYIAVTINNDTQWRRGWHDQFGGTLVVKTR